MSDPVSDVLNRAADRLEGDGEVELLGFSDGTVGAYGPDDDWTLDAGPQADAADVVTALRQAAQLTDAE